MIRIDLRIVLVAMAGLGCLFMTTRLMGQEPGNVPETKAPATTQTAPAAATPATADDWKTQHERQLREDWPWLAKFHAANLLAAPPRPDENRVVFMGDSITEAWTIEGPAGYFPGKPYFNRGISGQTTPQMLLRFRQDVINLKPKVVVILAGTNDIAGNTGVETIPQIEGYLMSMAELAAANHIRVVLCSILPAYDYPWTPGLAPAAKIMAINEWLKGYAANNGHVYVDFHTAMKDERNGLPAKLSYDGVHPLPAGYAIMSPLVKAGIEKALAQ